MSREENALFLSASHLSLKVLKGEVIDGTFISAKALDEFLKAQVAFR